MIAAFLLAGALAAAPAAAPATARARAGDPAWARCVWQSAPASAANWLAMPRPRYQPGLPPASERLGHRLRALCSVDVATPRDPGRMPNWGRLASALSSARPRSPGAVDAADALVSWCEHRHGVRGDEMLYLYDVVRGAAGGPIAFQLYFGNHEGGPVRLPQGLRVLPGADAETSTSCKPIDATGELGDA